MLPGADAGCERRRPVVRTADTRPVCIGWRGPRAVPDAVAGCEPSPSAEPTASPTTDADRTPEPTKPPKPSRHPAADAATIRADAVSRASSDAVRGTADRARSGRRATSVRIDLNADVGESFGPWPMGDDERLIPLVIERQRRLRRARRRPADDRADGPPGRRPRRRCRRPSRATRISPGSGGATWT